MFPIHRILSIAIICLLISTALMARKTNVVLRYHEAGWEDIQLDQKITDVLNSCNRRFEFGANDYLEGSRDYFSDDAYDTFTHLVEMSNLYAIQREYECELNGLQNGLYEIRSIRVRVSDETKAELPFENLVFVVNRSGRIVDSHFAVSANHYENIISKTEDAADLANREKILHFIELYRTAYNKKDHAFVAKTLSDDALIIVGHVVQTREQDTDYLSKSYLGSERIEFLQLKKHEYLERLVKVFELNEFVHIEFDQIKIVRHHIYPEIYGVELKQRWNSSTYEDEGYLFLMVDFVNPEEPVIHVRAWQPEMFEDGSTINLYEFKIQQ